MDDPILTIEEREAINSGRWFSSLSPSLRHDILRCAFVKRYKDGDLIAARGDPPDHWIACAKGAVRVSSTAVSGKQVTLTYVEPGIWFGDVAMFDGDRRTHDTYSHGDSTILCVARADFQKILASHVELYEAHAATACTAHPARCSGWWKTSTPCRCVRAWPSNWCTWCAATVCPAWTDGQRDAHQPAPGSRRTGPVAGGLAPACQPGTEEPWSAKARDPHRTGRPDRAVIARCA